MTRVKIFLGIALVTALTGCAPLLQPLAPTPVPQATVQAPATAVSPEAGTPTPMVATATLIGETAAAATRAAPSVMPPATPTPSPSPSATATPIPELTVSPVPTGVTVTTDRSLYRPGDVIIVTIQNALGAPIYGLTGRTYCTIVSVERKEDSIWKEEGSCIAGAPPTWVEIPAGARETVNVFPRLFDDKSLPVGRYRVVFPYWVESTSGPDHVSSSPEFVIAAP